MDSSEYHRLLFEYENDVIAAVGRGAGVVAGAYSAKDGMHPRVLQIPPNYDWPTIYVRICASRSPEKLDAYLQETLGFVKGKDYDLHNNGVLQPACYFDFCNPDAIERLESHATEKGFYAEQEAECEQWRQRMAAEANERYEAFRREAAEAQAAKRGWLQRILQRQAPDSTKAPQK